MNATADGNGWQHTTVLLVEAVDALVTDPDGIYLDGTFGRGGHSRRLLSKLSARGRVVALDRDPEAVAAAADVGDARLTIRHACFARMAEELAALDVT